MKDMHYVLQNFFTHKDYLVSADLIPGTIYTPLQFVFEAVLLAIIIGGAFFVSTHKKWLKPTFLTTWILLLIWEVAIVTWDSVAGETVGLDLVNNLSLYPCSIFLYVMPFALWGNWLLRKMACGYVCTLGLLGALVNFLYPISRLSDYSCISFAGFHTFFFHGTMLFTCIVMLGSKYHTYTGVQHWWELLLPSCASLVMSIPANLINYSKIDSDYMYFKGHFPLLSSIFGNTPEPIITCILYVLYLCVPALFYLPSYISNRRKRKK